LAPIRAIRRFLFRILIDHDKRSAANLMALTSILRLWPSVDYWIFRVKIRGDLRNLWIERTTLHRRPVKA